LADPNEGGADRERSSRPQRLMKERRRTMPFPEVAPWSATEPIRVGMIVPSSNVTMERELPAMLRAREAVAPERFSVHSSRVRMRSVTPTELAAMNQQAERAAAELGDAAPHAVVYACLVAVMAEGPGAHRHTERQLTDAGTAAGRRSPVVSSAGALVETLRHMDARRVALVAPYLPQLTAQVCAYLGAEGVDVVDPVSLSVADNAAVGTLPQEELLARCERLPREVDAVVLSACVQMPSLRVIDAAERRLGLPVISAATATLFQLLRRLGLGTRVPGAGRLLSGAFDGVPQAVR
jgi:maleate isomerase